MRRSAAFVLAAACAAAFALTPLAARAAEPAVVLPPPAHEAPAPAAGLETAVIAGGCFWGVQAVYQHVKGVTNAVSGYAGDGKANADYGSVTSHTTRHAESVQVTFDPKQISYGKILQIYFSVVHDPTQLDRQGPDVGRHYRSEIFPQSAAQAETARAYIAQLDAAKVFRKPIVTRTGTLQAAFYPAEAYHQDYAVRHPFQPYIVYNDAPKVANLKRLFPALWRDKPVLVSEASRTN